MAFQFNGSGGGRFTGFRPTPANNPRASIFTFPPLINSGASNALSATENKAPPSQSKTAATVTRVASTPKGQPSRKHFKQTVTIFVGTSKQPFILHKGLLCFYSDFFRAALESSFKEANEGKVELPDVEVDVFEAFQVWLYSRSLRNIEDHEESSEREKLPSFQTLAYLWVFGDKYQIPLLQNNSIDALFAKNKEEYKFDTTVVQIAYSHTMYGSPLRKLAIDICVFDMCHGPAHRSIFINANSSNWNQEALIDVASCMSAAWQRKLLWGAMPPRDKLPAVFQVWVCIFTSAKTRLQNNHTFPSNNKKDHTEKKEREKPRWQVQVRRENEVDSNGV